MSTIENMAGLLGHLNRHRHLAETAATASASQDNAHVHVWTRDAKLPLLAAWERTLRGVEHIRIDSVDDDTDNLAVAALTMTGQTAALTTTTVTVVLDRDEADLVAANTPLVEDATFPVELLHQLTSAADAEAVARG